MSSRNGNKRSREQYYEPRRAQLQERAVLVGVHLTQSAPGGTAHWADLNELARLADTAGAEVLATLEQRRERPDVRSLLGKGKAEQLKQLCSTSDANLVIFDNDLTPAQGRNLEKMLELRVIDRTELILDIFARHARTRQARLQVALAQYEYLLPRLARMWKHLERQAGGIGTRGPGETQIETDRRIIRRRVTQLQRDLREIDRRMETQHKQRATEFRVALVGYTNAGKSSLMNRVTEAGVHVQDQLFATLDATTRRVELDAHRGFLLTDTVGFLRKLPHHLVESFRATLTEVDEADLLLHVVDASAEDVEAQIEAVEEVLKAVCRERPPELLVFNKMDAVEDEEWVQQARVIWPGATFVSALSGDGVEELTDAVAARMRAEQRDVLLKVDLAQPRSMAQLHELAHVLGVDYDALPPEVRLRVGAVGFGRILRLAGVEVVEVGRTV